MAFLQPTSNRPARGERIMLRSSMPGRRAVVVVTATAGPHPQHSLSTPQPLAAQQRLTASQPRILEPVIVMAEHSSQSPLQASSTATTSRAAMLLSSTTSSTAAAAAAAEASLPTAFARVAVGAALALSTVYTLLSSPASSVAGSAFSPPAASKPPSPNTTTASPAAPATTITTSTASSTSVASATAAPTMISASSLPILRTPEHFDAFVLASNRAGYLAIVLFHAPWCTASRRMEVELQRLSHLFVGRRIVFARVDCSIKQGVLPGQPRGQPPRPGFKLQRCDLTQLHRIHKTPTMRMYYNNGCVDEIIGCRPVDFRQAVSDMTFKYNL